MKQLSAAAGQLSGLSRIVPHLLADGWTLGEIEDLCDWLENQR
jgi:hypothetical protein